jgi:hypothetical protein
MRVLAVALTLFVLWGCDGSSEEAESAERTRTTSIETTSAPIESDTETRGPPEKTDPTSPPDSKRRPLQFSTANAVRTVGFLAGRIGPREATSASYARAARWVAARLRAYGYRVQRQVLRVPAGVSWGVPVPAGRTWNVIATQAGFHLDEPHLMVGAQLDTVPQAPGAEDNASGISVMLEVARLASKRPTRLPVVFVAFAAEEPRGDGEAWHHYGSRAYVQRMSPTERSAMRGLANPDRSGVGRSVPVCIGGLGPEGVKRSMLELARQLDIPATDCINTTSDHWSFEQAGMPAARLGGTDYPQYHSPADLPRVVRPIQLHRTGTLIWQWLRTGR